MLAGFIVAAVYAALSLAAAAISALGGVTRAQFEGQPGLPPEISEKLVTATEIATLIFSVLSPFVWWISVSLVMQLATRFFGGEVGVATEDLESNATPTSRGPFAAMLAVVGVAEVPLALGSLVQALATGLQVALGVSSTAGVISGLVGGLVALATLVWHVVLVVIGASLARRIGYGESAGSCAISCVGCLGLIILVAVVLVGIGILISTTAPQ